MIFFGDVELLLEGGVIAGAVLNDAPDVDLALRQLLMLKAAERVGAGHLDDDLLRQHNNYIS